MSFTFTYSLSGDFGGSLGPEELRNEIQSNAGITPECLIVSSVNSDDVDIIFSGNLTVSQQTMLTTLVGAHSPDYSKKRNKHFVIYPESRKINHDYYKTIATFHWVGDIDYIDVVARKHNNITSFDMQVVDITNNNVIASKNCTNDDMNTIDLGTISNVSTSPAILEVRAKKNGGTNNNKIFVEEVLIYYDN